MTPASAMIVIAALTLLLTLNPRLLALRGWRATVTPLASIIGSGFLVAAPVLGHVAGGYAIFAMAALCAAGWLFGSAIKTNIRVAEPLLAGCAPRWLVIGDEVANLALLFAYFISVAYYLNLFAAFGLRLTTAQSATDVRIVASIAIGIIGLIGVTRGLHWLEDLELPAVGIKLALIAGLVGALLLFDGNQVFNGGSMLPVREPAFGFEGIRVLLGLFVLVQGFETSRYLGHSYDAELRIRTMRRAQWVSTGIYLVFVGLAAPLLGAAELRQESATEVIDLLTPLGWAVSPLIIIAALASQFSAGVADMSGAGGLVSETARRRVSARWGYLLTATVAIVITWSTDIFGIIAFASRAFVVYYGIQSLIAARLSTTTARRYSYFAAALLAAIAVVLGRAANAG